LPRPSSTSAREPHHAVAEQHAADEHQWRRKRRLQIDRLAEIDHLAHREKLGRRDRDPHCQRIGAHQPAVTLCPPAAQAAHHAEAAQQSDRAIDEADQQTGEDHDIGSGWHD
jgi:hypothetical protein